MNREVDLLQEFAREVFCFLKETVYGLGGRCECNFCYPHGKCYFNRQVITKIAKIVLFYSESILEKFRKTRLFALKSTDIKIDFQGELEIVCKIADFYKTLNVFKKPCILTMVSEVFLFRYFMLRRTVHDTPCYLYVQAATSCFVLLYKNTISAEYPRFSDFFLHITILKYDESVYKKIVESPRQFIIGSNSHIYTWREMNFIFKSMGDEKLVLRYPSVYSFIDSTEEGELDDHVKRLSERYKNFQKYIWNSKQQENILFTMDPLLDIFINKVYAMRVKRSRAKQNNEERPIIIKDCQPIPQFTSEISDLIEKEDYRLKLLSILKCEGQPSQTTQDVNCQMTQDQSDQATQDQSSLLTQALRKDAAQRFARDLFFFLKIRFNLKENCKCEECSNKNKTPSVFTASMGATVFILSLTERKFFRSLIKTVVVKHYNPILTPEKEKNLWEVISSWSGIFMDEFKIGISYVLSLISEAYLFKYMKLRRHVDSNPCIDYLKACRLCFKYVYENVLQNDNDFVHSLEKLVVSEASVSKSLELLIRMENNLKYETVRLRNDRDKNRYKSKSKKSKKNKNLNLWYIMEELEPKFVTSCEFVDPLCYDETCNINRAIKYLSVKYIAFQKLFRNHVESSELLMETRNPEIENSVLTFKINSFFSISGENHPLNLILENIVDELVRDPSEFHVEPPPRSPEEFAGNIFYLLKKMYSLNYSCKCEICQMYDGKHPNLHTTYLAMNILAFSLIFRTKFRLETFHCMEFKKKPDRDVIMSKIKSVYEEFEELKEDLGIFMSMALISEVCLEMFLKLFDSVCYLQESVNYFLYVYNNIFNIDFREFEEYIDWVILPQENLTLCQMIIYQAHKYFLQEENDDKELDWSWFLLERTYEKIPNYLLMACLYAYPRDLEMMEEIEDRLYERYKKLQKKHGRVRSVPPFTECIQLFPGDCTRNDKSINRTRRVSA